MCLFTIHKHIDVATRGPHTKWRRIKSTISQSDFRAGHMCAENAWLKEMWKTEDLDQLFSNRAKFLSQNYGGTEQDYFDKVASEFCAIQKIENSNINLWFEDDLFCQVNFWFVSHLLQKSNKGNKVYLVRPRKHTTYGFGGLDESELISMYENRRSLMNLESIAKLWEMYQQNATDQMLEIAEAIGRILAFRNPSG